MCVANVFYFDFLELQRIRGGKQSFKMFGPFWTKSAKIWPQICPAAIIFFGSFSVPSNKPWFVFHLFFDANSVEYTKYRFLWSQRSFLRYMVFLCNFNDYKWSETKSEPEFVNLCVNKLGFWVSIRDKGRGAIDLRTGSYISQVLLGRG